MSTDSRADPDCPMCQGTGSILASEREDEDGYWTSYTDCFCIPVKPISEELRKILADALSKANA